MRDRTPPVGIPLPWPRDRPPAGWFKCNGASFDINQFPRLASAYPAGRLPDLRGEFIRGWDDGRGVDLWRVILSHQDCEIQSHNHSTPIRMFAEQGLGNPWGSGGDKYEGDYIFNSHYTGGNETRPRNVAFMYIVKAE
ncbi:MAG: tail fiber protein [Snodgrassella sp.]|nr:tail fiber protein [Snodgrassella sp.]MCO6555050.1 tail fiber protein [Gilliamella sp.]